VISEVHARFDQFLASQTDLLAKLILNRYAALYPDAISLKSESFRSKTLQDIKHHLTFLREAVACARPGLFIDYAVWVKVTLAALRLPEAEIRSSFDVMREVLCSRMGADLSALTSEYIDGALDRYSNTPEGEPSFIHPDNPLAEPARSYLTSLMAGDRETAVSLIQCELEKNAGIKEIYLNIFMPVQSEIGRLWQMNRVSICQEHFGTAVTQFIMSRLYPRIYTQNKNGHVMVATCIAGELHEIGMRMVTDFFEMEHWSTHYLGANIRAEGVISAVVKHGADILGISTTMTSHLSAVRDLISAIRNNKQCGKTKILVGGYLFNAAPDLWAGMNADGYAANPQDAVALANRLVTARARS
jgi:MerR family transcriptional regulator, light-induced transcriptional regulator